MKSDNLKSLGICGILPGIGLLVGLFLGLALLGVAWAQSGGNYDVVWQAGGSDSPACSASSRLFFGWASVQEPGPPLLPGAGGQALPDYAGRGPATQAALLAARTAPVLYAVEPLAPNSGQTAMDTMISAEDEPPVLHMDKAVAPDHAVVYRTPVTYTITMSNTGQSPAAGVWMTDTLWSAADFAGWVQQSGAGLNGNAVQWHGTIDPGQVISWSWVMSQHFGYNMKVQNMATWHYAEGGTSGTATTSFTVEGGPVIALVKSVTPAHDAPYHGTVTYTIGMTNSGGLAYGVTMSDPLLSPPQMQFAGWVEQNEAVHEGNTISWTGTMSRGTALWWSWVVTQHIPYNFTVQNMARYGHDGSGASGTATTQFTVQNPPVLAIGKWVEPDNEVSYHGEVTYTAVLTNSGGLGGGTFLTDILPSEVGFVRWVEQNGAERTGETLTWSGDLPAGSSQRMVWVVRHTGETGGAVTNTVDYAHPDTERSGSAEAVFRLDDIAPDPPVLQRPPDGSATNDDKPELGWAPSRSADTTGYWLDFAGAAQDVGDVTAHTTTVLADGTYTWTVAAYDHLRNTSAYTDVWLFTVDTIPPEPPTLHRPLNGSVLSDTTPLLEWLASPSPDVVSYTLRIDDIAQDVGNVTTYTTGVLVDGTYTWTVGAFDLAGNRTFTGTWAFRVDTVPPQVSATLPLSEDMDVAARAPLVVTFSEPVITMTVTYAVDPDPGGWLAEWDGNGTVVTLTHEVFAAETWYTATVLTAVDHAGNRMVEPYGWAFRTGDIVYYLPLILKDHILMPDLEVSLTGVTADQGEIVVTNVAHQIVSDDFWVDVSFDPRYRPQQINQR